MVTSFSTRLLELSSVCDPITDNKRKRENDASTDHISSIGESNMNSRGVHDSQPISSEKSSYKRQGYYYAHSHQHDSNNGVTANKRRRQKEDLRYAAATIQQSLRDAGHDAHDMSSILQNRRERALPMGSVDMSTVKIVTSAKFDSEMNDGEECLVVDEEEQDDNMIDGQSKAGTKKSSDVDQEEEYNTVSSMYMLSSLIQSTRQYYSFTSDDTKTTRATGISSSTSLPPNMNNQNFTNNHEKSLPRSDSSEGLSSWTPLSSENDLNDDGGADNDDKKKDIDNDNRSDGQSSDMDDTSASSSTSNSEGETSSGSDGVVKEDNMGCINWDGAYSTIG